jgi:hypothetical protein
MQIGSKVFTVGPDKRNRFSKIKLSMIAYILKIVGTASSQSILTVLAHSLISPESPNVQNFTATDGCLKIA